MSTNSRDIKLSKWYGGRSLERLHPARQRRWGVSVSQELVEAGFKVLGFDIQQERVDSVNRGMVLTNHPEIAEEVNVLRNHGCKTVLISPAETSETLL